MHATETARQKYVCNCIYGRSLQKIHESEIRPQPTVCYRSRTLDISRLSPNWPFAETTVVILDPSSRAMGPVLSTQLEDAITGSPLPLAQSVLLV